MTTMPNDNLGRPLPILGFADGGAKTIAIGATTTRNTTPIAGDVRVVSLYATTACFVRFGDATVTATASDHFLPGGVYLDVAVGPDTKDRYIATLRSSTDGTLYVSERV